MHNLTLIMFEYVYNIITEKLPVLSTDTRASMMAQLFLIARHTRVNDDTVVLDSRHTRVNDGTVVLDTSKTHARQ